MHLEPRFCAMRCRRAGVLCVINRRLIVYAAMSANASECWRHDCGFLNGLHPDKRLWAHSGWASLRSMLMFSALFCFV